MDWKFLRVYYAVTIVISVILITGAFLYASHQDNSRSVTDFYITNITDTAFTIVWQSDDIYPAEIIYQESGKTWTPIVSQNSREVLRDDRDQDDKNQVSRYTHHVTINDLKPETDYEFRLKGLLHGKTFPISKVTTLPVPDSVIAPDPGFGSISGANTKDSVVILENAEGKTLSKTIASNETYSFDLNLLKTDEKKVNPKNLYLNVLNGLENYQDYQYKEANYKPFETIIISETTGLTNQDENENTAKITTSIVRKIDGQSNKTLTSVSTSALQEDALTTSNGNDQNSEYIDVPRSPATTSSTNNNNQTDTGNTTKPICNEANADIYVNIFNQVSAQTNDSSGAVKVTQDSSKQFFTISETGRFGFYENSKNIASYDFVVTNGNTLKVRLYYDTNNNYKKDASEKYMTDYSGISMKKDADAIAIELARGWNLIHIPMTDTRTNNNINSAKKLLDYWTQQGANIAHIASYKDGTFEYASKTASGKFYDDDFDLARDKALFVLNLGSERSVTYSGQKLSGTQIDLKTGWNMVGIVDYQNKTSETYLREKIGDGINTDLIANYNDGIYSSVIIEKDGDNDLIFGNNFELQSKQGYFIRVKNE